MYVWDTIFIQVSVTGVWQQSKRGHERQVPWHVSVLSAGITTDGKRGSSPRQQPEHWGGKPCYRAVPGDRGKRGGEQRLAAADQSQPARGHGRPRTHTGKCSALICFSKWRDITLACAYTTQPATLTLSLHPLV